MIKSKEDLAFYLESDRLSSHFKSSRPRPFKDHIWRFQILMRQCEYFQNCRKDLIGKLCFTYLRLKYEEASIRLGFTIPLNVFGPGLSIAHRGTIVVNGNSKVGANCRLHVCVNIGTAADNPTAAPVIGNNVYIGPGVKMFGAIEIADDIAIGANAVVTKSFVEPNITIAGIPAQKIADKGTRGLIKIGTEKASV